MKVMPFFIAKGQQVPAAFWRGTGTPKNNIQVLREEFPQFIKEHYMESKSYNSFY